MEVVNQLKIKPQKSDLPLDEENIIRDSSLQNKLLSKDTVLNFYKIFEANKFQIGEIYFNRFLKIFKLTETSHIHPEQIQDYYSNHLSGHKPIGLFNICANNNGCKWIAVDIDIRNTEIRAQIEDQLTKLLWEYDSSLLLFDSKSRGFHIYKFYSDWVDIIKAHKSVQDLKLFLQKRLIHKDITIDVAVPSVNKIIKGERYKIGKFFNTPYFNCNKRCCVGFFGNRLSIQAFFAKYKYRQDRYLHFAVGCPEGKRDNTAFALAAYIQKNQIKNGKEIYDEILSTFEATTHAFTEAEDKWEQGPKYNEINVSKFINNNVHDLFKTEGENQEETQESFEDDLDNDKIIFETYSPNYQLKKREWLIDGILKKKNFTVITGAGGSGKTQFLIQMAYAIATGKPFFKKHVRENGSSFLLVGEEDCNEAFSRLRAIENVHGANLSGNQIHIVGYTSKLKLVRFTTSGNKKTSQFEELENIIKDLEGIKFLGIDPLINYQTGSFDENSNTQMDTYVKDYLVRLSSNLNIAVAAGHHTNKISMLDDGDQSDIAMYSARGASALSNAARVVIGLAPMTNKLWESEYKSIIPFQKDRMKYVAVVDAKNNYAEKSAVPLWIKKEVNKVECIDGIEELAVFVECNISELADKRSDIRQEYNKKAATDHIQKIHKIFEAKSTNEISIHSIAEQLSTTDPQFGQVEDKTLIQQYKRMLTAGLKQGIQFNDFIYEYYFNNISKTKHNIKRVPQKERDEVPF